MKNQLERNHQSEGVMDAKQDSRLHALFLHFTSGTRINDGDWLALETALDEEHEKSVQKLRKDCPQISETDVRICMMKELGLTWRQMAAVVFLEKESVRKRHLRLKKKFFLHEK